MIIRDLSDGPASDIAALSHLLDHPAETDAITRFVAEPNHFLFVAYDGDVVVGFVSGVETTHPDKGTEMFLYELAVDESSRNRGVGTALVTGLADTARARGCYGMWVLTDHDNDAAIRTYTAAGATDREDSVMLSWTFPSVTRR
jgi:[ribosomal protein S18]-alanine N-acetyltransferase